MHVYDVVWHPIRNKHARLWCSLGLAVTWSFKFGSFTYWRETNCYARVNMNVRINMYIHMHINVRKHVRIWMCLSQVAVSAHIVFVWSTLVQADQMWYCHSVLHRLYCCSKTVSSITLYVLSHYSRYLPYPGGHFLWRYFILKKLRVTT